MVELRYYPLHLSLPSILSSILLIASVIFLISIVSASSVAPPMEWSKNYGTYEAYVVIQTGDGGYAIAGSDATYGPHGYYNYSALLIKTDSLGEIQWRKTYSTELGGSAFSMVQTQDSGYLLNGGNGLLLKVDAQGNVMWNKTLGLQFKQLWFIQSSDGGYVMDGYLENGYNGDDAVLLKTDLNGNILWNRTFSEPSVQFVRAGPLVETNDKGYAFAGTWGTDFWFAKTNTNGDLQLNETYHFSDTGNGFDSIANTVDGGYILVGLDNINSWLVKIDSQGNIKWHEQYSAGTFQNVVQTPDGGYLAAGQILIKTNSSGSVQWSNATAGLATSAIVTKDGGYTIAGFTYSGSIWLVKFAPESGVPSPSPSSSSSASLTPSPSIPEFPSWTILPIFAVTLISVGVISKRKKPLVNDG